MKSFRPNYNLSEVEALVDYYAERGAIRSLTWLVEYWDLSNSLKHMPPKEYQAVLLVGLIGLDIRTAGREMGVSHDTMWTRYRRGLQWLTDHLNGVVHS